MTGQISNWDVEAGFFWVKAAVDRGLPFCSRVGQHARRSVASSSGLPWTARRMVALLDRCFMIFYEDILEDGAPNSPGDTKKCQQVQSTF